MTRRTYLFDASHQRKCRLNGIRPSQRLPSKPQLRGRFEDHLQLTAPQLPHKVDLRSLMTTVEDQSDIGSCGANAMAGAYEYLLKQTSGSNIDVSRLFIYYNARLKDGVSEDQMSDEGCTVTAAIEAMEEYGTCLESIWPYNTTRVNTRPNDDAYEAAETNRIIDALQIKVDLFEMKSCLAQGFPFIFGLELYKSFDHAEKKGVVPMPKPSDKGRESHGRLIAHDQTHAMLAVGYSDRSKAFIVRNSWGSDWGDQGYCYIPYGYMTDENYCFDLWTVRRLESDDMGHDHWDEDDSVDYTPDDDEGGDGEDGDIEEVEEEEDASGNETDDE